METKKCPYCGGEILAVAKKCKHCGKWLEEKATPADQQTPTDSAADEKEVHSANSETQETSVPSPIDSEEVNSIDSGEQEASASSTIDSEEEESDNSGMKLWLGMAVAIAAIVVIVLLNHNFGDSHKDTPEYQSERQHSTFGYKPGYESDSPQHSSIEEEDEEYEEEQEAQQASPEDKKASVTARINQIYSEVFSDRDGLEQKYFSEDFYDIYSCLLRYEEENNPGEIGLIDYNIWTQAQDGTPDMSVEVRQISFRNDYNDNEFADANINVVFKYGNSVKKKAIKISFVKSDDNWYVDDLQGLKGDIKFYLATN